MNLKNLFYLLLPNQSPEVSDGVVSRSLSTDEVRVQQLVLDNVGVDEVVVLVLWPSQLNSGLVPARNVLVSRFFVVLVEGLLLRKRWRDRLHLVVLKAESMKTQFTVLKKSSKTNTSIESNLHI